MKHQISQKLKNHRMLSVLITILGATLMIYMMMVEDEPGALPLLLLLIGISWAVINQYQIKTHLKKQ